MGPARPDRIGASGAGTYQPAIVTARNNGLLARSPIHYVTKHLQQGVESDHFRLKNMPRIDGFRSLHTVRRVIQGFGAMLWLHRASGSRAHGPCASRIFYSPTASSFRPRTMRESGTAEPLLHLWRGPVGPPPEVNEATLQAA
jgi:hypothetical protein